MQSVYHQGVEITPDTVSDLLLKAKMQARALAADAAVGAKALSEKTASIAVLGNLPPGVVTALETISKVLGDEVLKIEQQLEKSAPKETHVHPVSAAA